MIWTISLADADNVASAITNAVKSFFMFVFLQKKIIQSYYNFVNDFMAGRCSTYGSRRSMCITIVKEFHYSGRQL